MSVNKYKQMALTFVLRQRQKVLRMPMVRGRYYGRLAEQSRQNPTVKISHSGDPQYKLGVFLRTFNEGLYVQEFIAFHMASGVEHFYIYDNSSLDNTVEQLQPFIARGIVTLVEWPGKPPSPEADIHCMNTYGHECEWIMCIDADEFVFTTDGRSLPEFLADFGDVPAVTVTMKYFGSSWHKERQPGLIIENYCLANPAMDIGIKSIVRPRRITGYGNSHYWHYDKGFAVNELRETVYGPQSLKPSATKVRLNHYVHKSLEEFLMKANPNYYVDKIGKLKPGRTVHTAEEKFKEHNEMEDRSALALLDRTREILAEIVGNSVEVAR